MKFLFLLLFIQNLYASVNTKYNFRRCLQLPILGEESYIPIFKIHEKIEAYFKKNDWCRLQSGATILTMLENYRPNLDMYLESPDFLREIADRTGSGSLIRIKVYRVIRGFQVSMQIIGDSGQNILFSDKDIIKSDDVEIISNLLMEWLEVYKRTIPYNGRILGVTKNQFTVDMGRDENVSVGMIVRVERPVDKKNHPLLDEIVEWQTNILGKGKVINVSQDQSLVEITQYLSNKKFQQDDWVTIEKKGKTIENKKILNIPKKKERKVAKLGNVSFGFKMGWGMDTTIRNLLSRRIVGPIFGPHIGGELWLTREMIFEFLLEKNIGSYQRIESDGTITSLDMVQGIRKLRLGYRFFFKESIWAPWVDIYFGRGGYHHSLKFVIVEGFGQHSLEGWLFGLKGYLPFTDKFFAMFQWDTLVRPKYEERVKVFGSDWKHLSAHQVDFGLGYKYYPDLNMKAGFQMTSNQGKFSNQDSFHFSDISLRLGVTFFY